MTSGITDPTEAYFKDGQWGWDGTVWRKLPMVWGYSDRYFEYLADENVSAGAHSLTSTAVPAGEVWVVQGAQAWDKQSAPGYINIYEYTLGLEARLAFQVAPAASAFVRVECPIVLKEGDRLRAYFDGCTLNDDIRFLLWGYKMKVAE